LGGTFGLGIIGARDFLGVLRIFGLVILSVCLIAPLLALAFVKWIGRGIKKMMAKQKQQAAMKPVISKNIPVQQKEPTPVETAADAVAEPAPVKEKKTAAREKEARP